MIGNILKIGGYALLAKEAADILLSSQLAREKQQNRERLTNSVTGSLVGVALGVGIGILFAPRPGKQTREMLAESASREIEKLQDGFVEGKNRASEVIQKTKDEMCAGSLDKEKSTAK